MPHSVRRWPQARLDLQDIWLAISEDSVRAADAVLDSLEHVMNLLAEYPELGPEREELGIGLRYYPTGSYLVFYTVSDSFIEIRRIMHGAREITAEISET